MANPIEAQVSPLFRAVLETVAEGVVVFDPDGRLVYSNARARRALAALGVDAVRADAVLPKLARAGSRIAPIWVDGAKLCEVVYLPPRSNGDRDTLAERERQAIIATLEQTGWKLTESARQLGISRTTLWRRLRAYGLDRDNRARWSRSS